jgi:hypothetical protein
MIEFKKGDIVTFHAYENERIKSKVCEIIEDLEGVRYRIEGISKKLISKSDGADIEESKLFIHPNDRTN